MDSLNLQLRGSAVREGTNTRITNGVCNSTISAVTPGANTRITNNGVCESTITAVVNGLNGRVTNGKCNSTVVAGLNGRVTNGKCNSTVVAGLNGRVTNGKCSSTVGPSSTAIVSGGKCVSTIKPVTKGTNVTINNGVCNSTVNPVTAGNNVSINNGVCNSTVDMVTAGKNVSINNGVCNSTVDPVTAGNNVSIDSDGVCNSTVSLVTAGNNVSINNGVCNSTLKMGKHVNIDSDGFCNSSVVAEGDAFVSTDGKCKSSVRAGSHTRIERQQCVVNSSACGKGTKMGPNGQCVVDTSACAVGTALINGVCTPNLTCGKGTSVYKNQCIVDAEGCGEGTILTTKQGSRLCVLDVASTNGVCGTGTMWDSGSKKCRPNIQIRPADQSKVAVKTIQMNGKWNTYCTSLIQKASNVTEEIKSDLSGKFYSYWSCPAGGAAAEAAEASASYTIVNDGFCDNGGPDLNECKGTRLSSDPKEIGLTIDDKEYKYVKEFPNKIAFQKDVSCLEINCTIILLPVTTTPQCAITSTSASVKPKLARRCACEWCATSPGGPAARVLGAPPRFYLACVWLCRRLSPPICRSISSLDGRAGS